MTKCHSRTTVRHFLISVLAVASASCGFSFAADRGSSIVEVTGEGHTFAEARAECVRLALQQTVRQLVVADRRVEDDKVMRDTVLSTMNGYVDGFEVITTSRRDDFIQITARVQVSESRIENFLGGQSNSKARIDGAGVVAAFERDRLAREARTEMLSRMFAGFPSSAFDVNVTYFGMGGNGVERDSVLGRVTVQANSSFIRNLKRGLDVLRKAEKGSRSDPWNVCFSESATHSLFGSSKWHSGLETANTPLGGRDLACIPVTGIEVETDLCPRSMRCYYHSGDIAFAYYFPAQQDDLARLAFKSNPVRMPLQDLVRWEPNYLHSLVIDEGKHTYEFTIPVSQVPEGAKEIRVVPIFVVGFGREQKVLRDLTLDGVIPMESPEFQQFVGEVLGIPRSPSP